MIGSQQGLPPDPASTVVSGHKLVVNFLTANTRSIQISHNFSPGADTLEAVFTDQFEDDAILAGCGISRSSC